MVRDGCGDTKAEVSVALEECRNQGRPHIRPLVCLRQGVWHDPILTSHHLGSGRISILTQFVGSNIRQGTVDIRARKRRVVSLLCRSSRWPAKRHATWRFRSKLGVTLSGIWSSLIQAPQLPCFCSGRATPPKFHRQKSPPTHSYKILTHSLIVNPSTKFVPAKRILQNTLDRGKSQNGFSMFTSFFCDVYRLQLGCLGFVLVIMSVTSLSLTVFARCATVQRPVSK